MTAPDRRALIVRGGWDGHQPVETTDSFIPFLRSSGFEVRVEEGTRVYADARLMGTVDPIVQINTMNTIEPDEFAGLQAAVLAGTGVGGCHGGIADSYRSNADYLHMIGGPQWGRGRIFVCAPGHRLEIVQNPNVRTIIERGLLWAAR